MFAEKVEKLRADRDVYLINFSANVTNVDRRFRRFCQSSLAGSMHA